MERPRAVRRDLPDELWARAALAAGACAAVSRVRRSLARRRLCRHRLPRALCRWLGLDPAHLACPGTRAADGCVSGTVVWPTVEV